MENRLVVARGWEVRGGKVGVEGQKVQTSSYKLSHGDMMYKMVTVVNNTVFYIWKLLRE